MSPVVPLIGQVLEVTEQQSEEAVWARHSRHAGQLLPLSVHAKDKPAQRPHNNGDNDGKHVHLLQVVINSDSHCFGIVGEIFKYSQRYSCGLQASVRRHVKPANTS